jgi:hypothetical protein
MTRYTNGTEVVDAIAWDGELSSAQAFVKQHPVKHHPKVTEDDPNALGIALVEPGLLTVFTEKGYLRVRPTDMLIVTAAGTLTVATAKIFQETFHPVP